MALAKDHSAVVTEAGKLYTFGGKQYKYLGHGEAGDTETPHEVPLPSPIREVALGLQHSAVVDDAGDLRTWGWGGSFFGGAPAVGFQPAGDVLTPTKVDLGGEKVKQVACGERHTAILTTSGRVLCAGSGEYGLLGQGDVSDSAEFESVDHFPDSVLEASGAVEPDSIVKIGCGLHHTVALTKKGELYCWGRNEQAQLGLGDESMGDNFSFEAFPRLVRALPTAGLIVKDFACGDAHTDVVTTCGKVFTWGNRNWLSPHRISRTREELETTEHDTSKHFVEDADGAGADAGAAVKKLVAGGRFSIILTEAGNLYGWGKKNTGCLPEDLVEPTLVELFAQETKPKVLDCVARASRCLAVVEEVG
eukprot:g11395.t1